MHWWIGFEIERLNFQFSLLLAFGDPSPILWQSEIDAPSKNCTASPSPPIRSTGRTPVVALIVICCIQYFTLSWHYYNGCAAGGLLKIFVEEQCPGYDRKTKRSVSSSQRCARIAPTIFGCSKEKHLSTTCQ